MTISDDLLQALKDIIRERLPAVEPRVRDLLLAELVQVVEAELTCTVIEEREFVRELMFDAARHAIAKERRGVIDRLTRPSNS